jgi:hypothetical protein
MGLGVWLNAYYRRRACNEMLRRVSDLDGFCGTTYALESLYGRLTESCSERRNNVLVRFSGGTRGRMVESMRVRWTGKRREEKRREEKRREERREEKRREEKRREEKRREEKRREEKRREDDTRQVRRR